MLHGVEAEEVALATRALVHTSAFSHYVTLY